MKNNILKKVISLTVAGSMLVGTSTALSGCGSSKEETITLDVYSQLANFSGMQTGWIADILKQKFNVKLNIIPDGDGVYETRMEDGNLGDIIIWGNDDDRYPTALKAGLLFDWNEDGVLSDYGKYIKKNMQPAIQKNQNLTSKITNGKSKKLYGIGSDIALSSKDHQMFIYNWDIRWDLYKKLGYPKVKNLDDYANLLAKMQKICPKDDNGNKTYAFSLWPDWDDNTVMYVKASATAYYGYDELGIGLYDSTNGNYHDALEKNGPYLQMLKFYNKLYQKGLIDPDSMTQTYDKMGEKVQNGGSFASIFNYCGSLAYNKDVHTKNGKLMYPLKPEDASPCVYGMNPQGGSHVTTIGASTEYPEKCMEIINYFTTPEGRMTFSYGPKGETWDYDKDGNTYFTELGKKTHSNENTKMGSKHKGTYHDGVIQASFSTWSIDAENPDSNGETYNSDNWKSNNIKAGSAIEQDWRDKTGCKTINDYLEKGKYTVVPNFFTMDTKDDLLKTTWSQVTTELRDGSWKALYAKNDAEYDSLVKNMISRANKAGYDKCKKWAAEQASKRYAAEQEYKSQEEKTK